MRNFFDLPIEVQLENKVNGRIGFVYPRDVLIPDTKPTRLFLGHPQTYSARTDIRLSIEANEVLVGRQKENGEYELLTYKR